ncbi:MAG TPA: Rieske 2Fe-2S domain-containing protein [Acidimicrobiales bacterium]|nr:Rieske 2Fe-2S domain-containing protein [Acidimicrobiales bacterium]
MSTTEHHGQRADDMVDQARDPALDPEHFFIEPGEPWPDDVPRDQDVHWWRFRDDPKGARKAELKIIALWGVVPLCAIALMILYVVGGQPQLEGLFLGTAMICLATGLVIWARDLLPGHEVTAKRNHQGGSGRLERTGAVVSLSRGIEGMARRPFLVRMLGGVIGIFGLAMAFPIASLGARPHRSLYKTGWATGKRLVDEDGRPLRPDDLPVNGILTVFPEGDSHANEAESDKDPQSATVLINLGDAKFDVRPGTQDWNVRSSTGLIVAFSKICTHAGCPVGLYNTQSHQLVCPCHQSTFDVLGGCNPVFGPASRSLPQLPLGVNADGYLVSTSDYKEPVGPGFWNRS